MKVQIINGMFGIQNEKLHIASLNPIHYFLKSFYEKNGKNVIEWLPAIYFEPELKEKPDIICFSLYLWNKTWSDKLAKRIKSKWPDVPILIGGPEVIPDKKIFDEFPWADYAIYGEGEEAFTLFIDSIHTNDFSSCINLITRQDVYPHRRFIHNKFEPFSPYTDCKEEYRQCVEDLKEQFGQDKVRIFYHRVRGCMYKCAFCNWQSGLHYKVSSPTSSWQDELDFISDLGVVVRSIDANFGMFPDDEDILEYALKMYREKNNGFIFQPTNFSKVKKDVVYKMINSILASYHEKDSLYPIKIALQDIHGDILANINRPDIPWKDHKDYLKKLRASYPSANIQPEIILGLPGFNLKGYKNQLMEFLSIPLSPVADYNWVRLPNSPADSKEYQDKHNLIVIKSYWGNGSYEDMVMIKDGLRDVVGAKAYSVLYNFCSNYLWYTCCVKNKKILKEDQVLKFAEVIFKRTEKDMEKLIDYLYDIVNDEKVLNFSYRDEHISGLINEKVYAILHKKSINQLLSSHGIAIQPFGYNREWMKEYYD